ncbi:hypothetical protein RJ639_013653 [Escallonia herrerae]|uniref:Uncharacterized protein n=1 Tax=Escallonia herrerae TaxID=1293975 RepID=A0AA89AN61_9ASTE|nr:hypothetical protein RJ639_013653 [Escallonia herrerae]
MTTSWVRTIKSPFKKACTFFNQQQPTTPRDKKSHQGGEVDEIEKRRRMNLHGEVMACAYEDVQVMWSILDKSKPRTCDVAS